MVKPFVREMREGNPTRWAVDFAEYLRFERDAAERHELIDGEIVAMAGATRRHNLLCGRLHDALRGPLGDGPCILERSDQRLAVDTASRA
jgi:Uma2 family endonuclease